MIEPVNAYGVSGAVERAKVDSPKLRLLQDGGAFYASHQLPG